MLGVLSGAATAWACWEMTARGGASCWGGFVFLDMDVEAGTSTLCSGTGGSAVGKDGVSTLCSDILVHGVRRWAVLGRAPSILVQGVRRWEYETGTGTGTGTGADTGHWVARLRI